MSLNESIWLFEPEAPYQAALGCARASAQDFQTDLRGGDKT